MRYALIEGATAPRRATTGSAGWDLCTRTSVTIPEQHMATLPLGVRLELPPWHVGLLALRSSLGGVLELCNGVGVIDPDYRGELLLRVLARTRVSLPQGARVAQLVVVPCHWGPIEEIPETHLSTTVRGAGGFGSTGV